MPVCADGGWLCVRVDAEADGASFVVVCVFGCWSEEGIVEGVDESICLCHQDWIADIMGEPKQMHAVFDGHIGDERAVDAHEGGEQTGFPLCLVDFIHVIGWVLPEAHLGERPGIPIGMKGCERGGFMEQGDFCHDVLFERVGEFYVFDQLGWTAFDLHAQVFSIVVHTPRLHGQVDAIVVAFDAHGVWQQVVGCAVQAHQKAREVRANGQADIAGHQDGGHGCVLEGAFGLVV